MLYKIEEKAKEMGFIKVGFSKPGRPLFYDRFLSWISACKNADMAWLERNRELREDPSMLLKGCKTVISLAYPYPAQRPGTPDRFIVSRYCQPTEGDYHQRLKKMCRELTGLIKKTYPESRSRACVDSAPILERSIAYSSGIGFIGKNNMLIIPEYGSYFYLAEILTTASMEFPKVLPLQSQCGSCTLCVESCPTGALEAPYVIDSRKCLSYLTIEHQGNVTPNTGKQMSDCFFGCDRCQEVCPFNPDDRSINTVLPDTKKLVEMTKEDFNLKFGKTALARAGLEKIKSNISFIKSAL